VIGADVPHADVIAHDEEDVGLFLAVGFGRVNGLRRGEEIDRCSAADDGTDHS
jgi:hypothetical protein